MRENLSDYNRKRDFNITAEPPGQAGRKRKSNLQFVVQLHHARRIHYDFRLEWEGVMKSWAVTKGPSFNPADRRLAVRTEDHPMDYNSFEGIIPDRQYGAGPVIIWDNGTWAPDDDPAAMEKKGHITFTLQGQRMKGHWHLIRMRTKEKRENWLLIKGHDDFALSQAEAEKYLKKQDTSIVSGRTVAQVRKSDKGDAGAKATKTDMKAVEKLAARFGKPELATLVDAAPGGDQWLHEIKFDGYRLMAFKSGEHVILRTRGGKDWTHKFSAIAAAIGNLPMKNAVLDMEAGVLDSRGRTSFSALQEALSEKNDGKIEAWIFDLLYLNGHDLTKKPLSVRKYALRGLMAGQGGPLYYSECFESTLDLLARACRAGAEGLVSKRKDSQYAGRRTQNWIKSKCTKEQEFVIGGFMPAKNDTQSVGALLLGYYKGRALHYAGKVGTGFSAKTARDTYRELVRLKTDKAPFAQDVPRGQRSYTFVKPECVCQIEFTEWTADRHIRHGSFKGLREDKSPRAVHEEIPQELPAQKENPVTTTKTSRKIKTEKRKELVFHGVAITHPDRIVFPDCGVTKGDIACYYADRAELMLPYMAGRLVSLLRCTGSIGESCFFQRGQMKGMGDHIHTSYVTHKSRKHDYIYIDDATGLMQLVQMGTIEFHTWQDRVTHPGKPDQMIFDLDPDESVPFDAVKLAAQDIRVRLKREGYESVPRVTGGKGIHVVVPLAAEDAWDIVKDFARSIAEQMQWDVPDAYIANMSKKKRAGKIFIDFFRNDFSATAIVPFSMRARAGAPLAWPVSWAGLEKLQGANHYRLQSLSPSDIRTAKALVKKDPALS